MRRRFLLALFVSACASGGAPDAVVSVSTGGSAGSFGAGGSAGSRGGGGTTTAGSGGAAALGASGHGGSASGGAGQGTGGGAGKGGGAGGKTGCAPLPSPAAEKVSPQPVYPAPRYVDVGSAGPLAHTACVDTKSLSAHAALDVLVPSMLAEAGLLAKNGTDPCACDVRLHFDASPPPLPGDAAKTWSEASASSDAYVVVQRTASDGRGDVAMTAASERAAMYALRTALAFEAPESGGRRLIEATVVDYPSFPIRGIVEGIYGPNGGGTLKTPYTPEDRATLIRMTARLRGNTYVYAPKADPYTRDDWRTLYPTDDNDGEQEVVATAAREADRNLVTLAWSIAPSASGPPYDGSDADFAVLAAKLDQVRSLGVRRFALFVDDIPLSSPAGPSAELMNRVDDYLKAKDPSHRLLVVGNQYCKCRDTGVGYNATLGATLHPDIEIMWTGNCIEPDTITAADMVGIDGQYHRRASIWDNWPNTPGGFHGRSGDLHTATFGYYANPVLNEKAAHPTDVFLQVLGPILDYTWFSERYAASGASEDASYQAWQPLLAKMKTLVQPCTPCGKILPGYTCVDTQTLGWCNGADGCLTETACGGGGCESKKVGVADACK